MNHSISKKVTSILTVGVIVVTIIWGFFTYYYQKNKIFVTVEKTANQTVQRLSSSVVKSLWEFDAEELDRIMTLELVNDNFLGILIWDDFGQLVIGRIKNNSGEIIPYSESDHKLLDDRLILLSRNVVKGPDKIGKIELYVSDKVITQTIRETLVWISIESTILVCFITILLFILLDKFLVKRIVKISEGIDSIEKGHYGIRLNIEGSDELSRIADSFNSMTVTVLERERELIISHEDIQMLQTYLSNIINSLPSVIITLDREGYVTQWNIAAENLTRSKALDIAGKKLGDIIPDSMPYQELFEETMRTGQSATKTIRQQVFGEMKIFNASVFPLAATTKQGVVLRLDDVTESEKRQELLRQAQKMETVGTLAGGLAHDFNNVLAGIIGTLSLLEFHVQKDEMIQKDKLRKYLGTIGSAAERATGIVRQLLTLSRKNEVVFEPVDLNQSIKHVMKICQNTFDKSVSLKPAYYPERAMTKADLAQLEQVLLNLCVNGHHAMTIMRPESQKKGGELTVSIDKIHIDKHFLKSHPAAEVGDYWRLSVSDTGIGMEQKTMDKIFDPFFTTKKEKGTGLGLSMVYNIIHQHNGFICVYSELRQGSAFHVYLPVLKGRVDKKNTVDTESATIIKGMGLLLVVDDEPVVRDIAEDILKECGYQTLSAENGEEGLRIFKERHKEIKAVLLDMVMPKMSGDETFREMKKIYGGVKVILSSGFKKDESVEAILNLGFCGFIQKPYSLANLARIVHEIIEN